MMHCVLPYNEVTRVMKVSIVIPVYNEAERLDACLRSIAAQTAAPQEVIVVDNNSSDDSAIIAQRYSFVKLLRENRQGVVHARNRGFDAASGDIIGRIDADSLLPDSWVAQVQALFINNQNMSAVSGAPHYYDFGLSRLADTIDYRLRAHLARKLGNANFLWGANMAVRRSAWKQVRSTLCIRQDMHEDFDLAIHLQAQGLLVAYEAQLIAGVSFRRVDTCFRDYVRYSLISPHTYAMHRLRGRYHMYPVLAFCWTVYAPARVIYRGYNPATGVFSFSRLLMDNTPRVDPTTNIAS
jgi:glycosyltransferase involved in cell wall biosynthesis